MTKRKRPENDIFAQIAVRRLAARSGLVEPAPLPVPDREFPLSRKVKPFRPRRRRDTPQALQRELAQQRKRYTKFLRDLAPVLPTKRLALPLTTFDWREETEADRSDFSHVLSGKGRWASVSLPHYGPPLGRAVTYYRTRFEITPAMRAKGALFVCLDGVDYKAHVFMNRTYLGSHEGFFAPFEFDFTAYARPGCNELVVKVENDVPMGSHGLTKDDRGGGDKIYAATGYGYDEPEHGWHHCPPGMGICQGVRIEGRSRMFVNDVFVRPDVAAECAEAWIEITHCDSKERPVILELSVFGQNFRKTVIERLRYNPQTTQVRGHGDVDQYTDSCVPQLMGRGVNFLRVPFEIPAPRLWEPDGPWLYQLQVALLDETGTVLDAARQQFGMRSFVQDKSTTPKGKFYLNGREIRLRGTNTMGSFQQCVMRKDLDQLRDDILLAHVCHINFLRLTQRPVQKEIYEYCDRLGMMTQTDLPTFGVIRRNQFIECVRQAEEMARLVRPHACNSMLSYINEPFPNATGKPHRFLIREELEDLFEVANRVIRRANPDQVIKCCDGDYDPPAETGMPDNHCYCGWYIGHGLDLGKLNRGYWIPVKSGWHYGCGEFGAEGLDPLNVMQKHYPGEWLPVSLNAPWSPGRIAKAQSERFHYLWYESPETVEDWIQASQEHQAWVVRMMTEAFRRDRRMNSFAIHLFIDAWPSGWMKTIMDVERQPKKAFFSYRDALTPLMVSLRADRTAFWGGETLQVEAWICNDTHSIPEGATLAYQLEKQGTVLQAGRCAADVPACDSKPQGTIAFKLPEVNKRGTVTVRLAILDKAEKVLHDTSMPFDVFPARQPRCGTRFYIPEGPKSAAGVLASQLGGEQVYEGPIESSFTILIGDPKRLGREIEHAVKRGALVVYLNLPPGEHRLDGDTVTVESCGMGHRHFVSRATGHSMVNGFRPNDFKFWFDESQGYATPLLKTVLQADDWDVILQSGNGSWKTEWAPVPVVVEKAVGRGLMRICQVKLTHRLMTNPVAALFAQRLVNP